jgi:hypothetical protein
MNKKKYLFDKIIVSGDKVQFIPYRKATLTESLMADSSSYSQKDWRYYPVSFRSFLKMLSKTKLNDDYEYDVILPLSENHAEQIDFEKLLQIFANIVYKNASPKEDVLSKFYNMAYEVRADARCDKELLERDVEDFIQ